MKEKNRKIGLIVILIFLLVLILAIVALIASDFVNIFDFERSHKAYESLDELLEQRYKGYNYNMEIMDNYMFVAISQKNIQKHVDVFEIIYLNNTQEKFEYEIIYDGFNFSMDYNSIKLREAENLVIYQYALFRAIEHKDYYIVFRIDTYGKIVEVSDALSDYSILESIDNRNIYYFNALPKNSVGQEYITKIELDDGSIYSFGLDEIIDALDW